MGVTQVFLASWFWFLWPENIYKEEEKICIIPKKKNWDDSVSEAARDIIGPTQKKFILSAAGASSQCYWDELMLLKC